MGKFFGTKFFLAALLFLIIRSSSFGQEKYFALPLKANAAKNQHPKIIHRDGVPFDEGKLPISTNSPGRVDIGCAVKRIFLLGMNESANIRMWFDPRDYSVRFFVGDKLGQIRLDYADGSTEIFPLVLGESIWWGEPFYRFPEPFPTDARLLKALASSLRLFPPAPVKDGNYVAVIVPKSVPLRSISFSSSPEKHGTPVIDGITIESAGTNEISGALAVSPQKFSPEFTKFVETKSLHPLGEDKKQAQKKLENLRLALYSSDETFFKGHVATKIPRGYSGPDVSFEGNIFAKVLENVFYANVQDIADKIDSNGMYHTSTKGAISWNGAGFGTFRTNVGTYYDASWCRDMGRSLQELTELGYTNKPARCADYCLRTARLWEQKPAPKIDGKFYPRHWGRVANRPQNAPPYENDAQGLISMFLYKFWQRIPDRDDWLRARWPDIKAAGDWILWQFAHPEISGATNGILHTTGESAAMNGYSVYPDVACMNALRALAQMADSIGETNSSAQWRERADKMQKAIAENYIINDPNYGRVWTLDFAGWPTHPTVLGPLILPADYYGFAPEDDNPQWHSENEAAFQRLIDTYKPFGFYGQAMGYGQGFVTQSALLLDRMRDATQMLDWIAKQVYDPRFGSFIVPEGVQIDPTGRFWFRAGDLGNGVQEAEIIKMLRIVIGVDDTEPNRLQFFPRMPFGWKEMAVKKYPVLFEQSGKMETAHLNYKLSRSGDKMKLEISSDKKLGEVAMRLGPFEKKPEASSVRINGKIPAQTSIERSGDSWWMRFIMSISPIAGTK
ncbi:MAG: hypothetical protein ACREFE_00980 [Limisphaerales bacterium]